MPLSRDWYSSVNKALPDTSTALRSHASMWHNFMRQITGASHGSAGSTGAPPASCDWTVHSSHACGVGAGAGNNFSAAFTASEWLRAPAANTHAWIVFQSPATVLDGPWYITVSLGTSSDQNAVVKISKTAPSGGTTTADPTSAVESTYTATQTHPNTTTAGKTHLVIDEDGNFYFWSSKNGSGWCHTWLCGVSLTEARSSGDSARFVLGLHYIDSSRGAPSFTTSMSLRGLHYDGATAANSSNLNASYLGVSSSTSYVQSITTLSAIDSKVDGIPCAYVFSQLAGSMAVRGRLPDCWLSSGGPAVGAGDPSGAAPERVALGGCIWPMGVTPGL